jgi:urea transport system substrate-binding protein
VIYTGQEATQQILASLDWVAKEKGAKSFFMVLELDLVDDRVELRVAEGEILLSGDRALEHVLDMAWSSPRT